MYQLAWRIRYIRIAYCDGISLTKAIELSRLQWKSFGLFGMSPLQALRNLRNDRSW